MESLDLSDEWRNIDRILKDFCDKESIGNHDFLQEIAPFIRKFQKAIETEENRYEEPEQRRAMNEKIIPTDKMIKELNYAILDYFEKLGKYKISDVLCEELNDPKLNEWKSKRRDIYREGNKIESIIYSEKEPIRSGAISDDVLFKLRFGYCLNLLLNNQDKEFIDYMRNEMSIYKKTRRNELKSLAGNLCFSGRVGPLKYKNDVNNIDLLAFERSIMDLYYIENDIPTPSYLERCVATGILEEYSEHCCIFEPFHSVFICPITKEQCTKENPPLILVCGHIISQEGFTGLMKIQRDKEKPVKCPYCPIESHQLEVKEIVLH
eukprot:GHVP01005702.1.p1 GENE.GHVP01005702.1~~GHVP01005702.1.p1  ORF type:complete len:322 (+),score=54.70 GHVP01005702.1:2-967(+)